MQDRELYSIEEARVLLCGIARNTFYELLRTAALPSAVIGRRRFISADSISAFVAAASTAVSPAVNDERGMCGLNPDGRSALHEMRGTGGRGAKLG